MLSIPKHSNTKKHVSKSISWCKISSPLTNEKCIHGLCEVVDVLIHNHLTEIKKTPLISTIF